MTRASTCAVMELLTSDSAILIFACAGLVATTVGIVRDTRAQSRSTREEEASVLIDSEKIAA